MRSWTLSEKIWNDHVVADLGQGVTLLHVDRHVVHEVTSKRAFERLRRRGATVRNPELTFAVVDHILATAPGRDEASNPAGLAFIRAWRKNCADFRLTHFDIGDERQGIVHVVAPELGITLPGTTLVCGDSHTSSNGAMGALAWGIGASEVEHVLATQCIVQRKPLQMRIIFRGALSTGVTAKDMILHCIGKLGTAAGRGHVVEYAGPTIDTLGIDARLTICNMSIEMGAKAGIIAPDDTTFAALEGKEFAPHGAAWNAALERWRMLRSDPGAKFDREAEIDCEAIQPQITWGTSPQDVAGIQDLVPDPRAFSDTTRRQAVERALSYVGLAPGERLIGKKIDYAFIGSCTNGRYADIEAAAKVARGRKVAPGVRAIVVPGSTQVKRRAELAGLDRILIEAGFEWHNAGCSMCVAANGDVVPPGKRCVATSNRNFENRQGPGSMTHLASPESVVASAIEGALADVRQLLG